MSEREWAREGGPDTIVVAVSGGLDSCALLHMLRFPDDRSPLPADVVPRSTRLVAAHFDHRMRPGSAADALWLRGLCAAWGIELVTATALQPPSSEAEARFARYAFLEDVRRASGARSVATAHHADDQAETVMFRLFRGTGPAGLEGVRRARADGVWRPLLDVWREDLLAYARRVGLGWREDPTNVELSFARNALRHRVLPEVEARVAPGARRALVRFAARAAHDEEGWESLLPGLIDALGPERGPDGVRFDRTGLLALHPAVRARVLRALARELGLTTGSEVTSLAVDFAASAESGRALDLGGSVALRRELDRLALIRPTTGGVPDDRSLVIPGAGAGSGHVLLAGRSVWVGWGRDVGAGAAFVERFPAETLRFPLTVRGWEDGDRIRTRAGTRKLKRVFLEARVPAPERRRVPVLTDGEGEVLWVPGVARAAEERPRGGPADRDWLPIGVE